MLSPISRGVLLEILLKYWFSPTEVEEIKDRDDLQLLESWYFVDSLAYIAARTVEYQK